MAWAQKCGADPQRLVDDRRVWYMMVCSSCGAEMRSETMWNENKRFREEDREVTYEDLSLTSERDLLQGVPRFKVVW